MFITYMYSTGSYMECRNNDLESTYIRLQTKIKEQVSKFPAGRNFDYRQLLNCASSVNETKLDKYYSADLVKFVDTVTTF